MKGFKSEKGGITVFVIIAFLFILTMLISMYMSNVNYQITTLQAEERIKEAYEKDVNNIDTIYEEISNANSDFVTVNIGERVTGSNGKYLGITIPEGFTVSKIQFEHEDVDDGIVIYDIPANIDTSANNFWTVDTNNNDIPDVQENFNQFVWVPVSTPYVTAARINEIITTQHYTDDISGTPMYTARQKAINYLINQEHKYPMAVQLADEQNYRGILYNFASTDNGQTVTITSLADFSLNASLDDYKTQTYIREPAFLTDSNVGDGNNVANTIKLTQAKLQVEYNAMIESVALNGGFWVARYELTTDSTAPISRGKIVATAADNETNTWYGLYDACRQMYNSNAKAVQSMMISGSQYDQIMIWMKDIINDKTQGNPKYIVNSLGRGNKTGSIEATGSDSDYATNQIFDLAGNLWEWTSEAYNNDIRYMRGGCVNSSYNSTYPNFPVSLRVGIRSPNYTSDGSQYYTTRSTLYVK